MKNNSNVIDDSYPYFSDGDILTLLLKKIFNIQTWKITLSFVIIFNLPILFSAIANNVLFSTPTQVGLLNDYSFWFLQISSVPATVYFFFWLPKGIIRVLNGLIQNKSIRDISNNKDKFNDFVKEFDNSYTKWIWSIFSLFLIAVFMIFFSIPEQKNFVIWQTSGPFIFWYTILFWAFFFYIGLLAVIKVIITVFWFNRLFNRFEIDVRVLHPDGAGGLSPLGDFSVKIGYVIGVYGIASVSASLSESYITTTKFSGPILSNALILLIATYIILAPIVFFAPIGAARSAMRAAKNEFLLQVSNQFEIETKILKSLLSSDGDILKNKMEKIDQLKKIHKMATSFPVWPFNVQNIVRFFSSISSPFILGIFTKLIDIILKP